MKISFSFLREAWLLISLSILMQNAGKFDLM